VVERRRRSRRRKRTAFIDRPTRPDGWAGGEAR
jgi:hypothetical protein